MSLLFALIFTIFKYQLVFSTCLPVQSPFTKTDEVALTNWMKEETTGKFVEYMNNNAGWGQWKDCLSPNVVFVIAEYEMKNFGQSHKVINSLRNLVVKGSYKIVSDIKVEIDVINQKINSSFCVEQKFKRQGNDYIDSKMCVSRIMTFGDDGKQKKMEFYDNSGVIMRGFMKAVIFTTTSLAEKNPPNDLLRFDDNDDVKIYGYNPILAGLIIVLCLATLIIGALIGAFITYCKYGPQAKNKYQTVSQKEIAENEDCNLVS
eukprot:449119_1